MGRLIDQLTRGDSDLEKEPVFWFAEIGRAKRGEQLGEQSTVCVFVELS